MQAHASWVMGDGMEGQAHDQFTRSRYVFNRCPGPVTLVVSRHMLCSMEYAIMYVLIMTND
ncbi:hypothetical protein LOK49_LG08G00462 [Camellia lanceoleosa]|uniref:Uncharacterized protein n=2 Tax=Camellia lanceoleosa TaxID=1840588 RepID=A0ACC0GW91_9ERIC|nr:hypothetical protein LOK49_LG08G00462 [Camellia lanceoleosa]